jgi:hypothetical protein
VSTTRQIHDATQGRLELAHEGDRVLLRICASAHDALPIYQVGVSPAVAVQIAQDLVRHAVAAGHGEPVTFTLGGNAR